MVRNKGFVIVFFLLLLFFSCKREGNPPDPPYLIPHSPDTLWLDEGIGAVPGRNAIKLEWEPQDEEMVDHYEIYRALNDTVIRETVADYFVDSEAEVNNLYTYWVCAVSFEGVSSEPSNEERYALLPLAYPVLPGDTTVSPPFKFRWNWEGNNARFILKLWRDTLPVFMGDTVLYGGGPVFEYPSPDTLEPGTYRWRVDCTGFGDNANIYGSRSSLKQFTVQ